MTPEERKQLTRKAYRAFHRLFSGQGSNADAAIVLHYLEDRYPSRAEAFRPQDQYNTHAAAARDAQRAYTVHLHEMISIGARLEFEDEEKPPPEVRKQHKPDPGKPFHKA